MILCMPDGAATCLLHTVFSFSVVELIFDFVTLNLLTQYPNLCGPVL